MNTSKMVKPVSYTHLDVYKRQGKFRHSDGVRYALRVLQKDVDFQFVRDEENHIIYIK